MASLSPHFFTTQFQPWGLHLEPDNLRTELQRAIDATEEGFDAIILGYGLCSKGIEDLVARDTKLVVTRGHDCMTCFLGSKERYSDYFEANPGAYWYTPGWIENHLSPGQERYKQLLKNYVETYGEDNAEYLMELEQDWFNKYSKATFIDTGTGDTESYEAFTKKCADWLKWDYEKLKGDTGLMKRLLNGEWNNEEFLVVEPGHMIKASNEADIITSVPADRTIPTNAPPAHLNKEWTRMKPEI